MKRGKLSSSFLMVGTILASRIRRKRTLQNTRTRSYTLTLHMYVRDQHQVNIQAGSEIMHDLLRVVYGGNQYIDAEWIGRARDVARVGAISVIQTRAKKS